MAYTLRHATVVTAHDGAEAIQILARNENEIDIVVLDMVMPRISGRQVLERLRESGRLIPVILTTGYAQEPLKELRASRGVRWMPKPFRQSDLALAIEELSAAESA